MIDSLKKRIKKRLNDNEAQKHMLDQEQKAQVKRNKAAAIINVIADWQKNPHSGGLLEKIGLLTQKRNKKGNEKMDIKTSLMNFYDDDVQDL